MNEGADPWPGRASVNDSVNRNREVIVMVHIIDNWQGFVQEIVAYVGHGNYWYCRIEYPTKKRHVFGEIDRKLIRKYEAGLSKFARARRKRAGFASFVFLRWDRCALILRNKGELPEDLYANDPDVFCDIRETPLRINASENISLVINHHGKVRVRMSRETYAGFKAAIINAATARNGSLMVFEHNLANGLPSYEGIIEQRRRLQNYTIDLARRHQIPMDERKLRVATRLRRYKVNAL
jgi:hypothetical protein